MGIWNRPPIGVHELMLSIGRENPRQAVVGASGGAAQDGDISVAEEHWGWNNVLALASHEENRRASETDAHQGPFLVNFRVVNVSAQLIALPVVVDQRGIRPVLGAAAGGMAAYERPHPLSKYRHVVW